ncbi:MAG TPA: SDR family oxidoreductase [Chitinophagaceae bacterium]|nr:SDR family oxidoreductase [Chitinophagaceae bacterium]
METVSSSARQKGKTRASLYDKAPVTHPEYKASGKLEGKVAIITGGDSGIGRSVAVLYAMEGCDVAIVYHENDADAEDVKKRVEDLQRTCLLFKGEIADENFCRKVVVETYEHFGKLSILVNNAAVQYQQKKLEEISADQLRYTFEVNIFSFYFFTKEAIKILDDDGAVINTTSVTAFRGSPDLMDYSGTKGAILAFTRALSQNLVKKGIRVNAVAPGPIWTPLVFESFDQEKLNTFGENTPMGRAGFPFEVAPAFVFLASRDASYISGQVIHVNGGEIVG